MNNNNQDRHRVLPPLRPKSPLHASPNLKQLFSEVISLKLLEFLEEEMQPHYQSFTLVEVALMVDRYIATHLLRGQRDAAAREAVTGSEVLPAAPKLLRNMSQGVQEGRGLAVEEEEALELLLEQMKAVFLYYAAGAVSYEMINEYVYNQQLRRLSNGQVDEDYIEIGEKRVRLDENLKLCIMPLAEEGIDLKTTKLKQLVFRQNAKGAELESIFAVTTDYVRNVRIKPELIGIAADFSRKGEPDCWYHYEPHLIRPKRSTVSVPLRSEDVSGGIEDKFSEQSLSILKVCVSDNLIGMISLQLSFVVEPLSQGRGSQGYIGNLLRDVPAEIAVGSSGEKYQEMLLFESYSDAEWLILSPTFVYLYRVPRPAENILLTQQNNLARPQPHRHNPLLLLCQRLPQGCLRAVTLHAPFLALMLDSNAVLIIRLVVNSEGVFRGQRLRGELNYFTVTNKIYNDVQFRAICFNPTTNNIFLSDFGAYLVRIAFNPSYGDVEEEGITHDRQHSTNLNQQLIRNSYAELKASRTRPVRRGVIHEVEGEEGEGDEQEGYIQVHYLKRKRGQQRHQFSLFKKQSSSPHTVVIKNQTRQVITFLTTNRNFNTLITYEAESYEKKTGSEYEGERYREWGNRNKIKLWDIRHMTIYKCYDVALELAFLQLRANGLFALTRDRGYLVFYPLNEDRKALLGEAEQRQLDQNSREVTQELEEVLLHGNSLYFSTLTSSFNKHSNLKVHRTHIYELHLQRYPLLRCLLALPSEVSALAVSMRLYVLENAREGVEASQLHVYNRLGLKEEVVVFSNPEMVSAEGKVNQDYYSQEYKFLRRIEHAQFQVVVWNADALKLLGGSPEESYTIVFAPRRSAHEPHDRSRAIKDIQVIGNSMLVYFQNSTRLRESGSVGAGRGEETDYSLILISNQLDRITYRLEHISPRVKVLHMYNELLLTREEEGDYDVVRVLDVGQRGTLEMVLFAGRFRRTTNERVRATEAGVEGAEGRNQLLQEAREFGVRRLITLQDTRVAVTKSNKLVVVLVFKVESHFWELASRRQVRAEVEFMVYGRNISEELLNANYKISKIQVGKKTEKHLYEYQTSTTRTESIFGHKLLSLEDALAISNYTHIDMRGLSDAVHADPRLAQGVDLTGKVLSPQSAGQARDIYEVLSLKKDPLQFERFQREPNQTAAINAFSFRIVEFSDDDLTGTITISNKLMRTLALYTFEIDCIREGQEVRESQQYELRMALRKVALLEVKSQREIAGEEAARKARVGAGGEVEHVRLLEWSEGYKSGVEQLWETTVASIKQFIQGERARGDGKRSLSLPPIALHKLNTLQIKKREMLKKKLSASSDRHVPHPAPKPIEPDAASLMFKKWAIGQAIHLENDGRDANHSAQTRNVNRYINKVLRSEEDTAERVQQLIKSTQKLKQTCSLGQEKSRSGREEVEARSMVVSHLESVLRSSQIAKEHNIRTYLQQKQRSPTEDTKQDYYKLSRNDTNKSELTLAVTDAPNPRNTSKLSNHTNQTRRSKTTVTPTDNSLDLKLKIKLDEIQERSATHFKPDSLKFYTPERMKTNPDFPSPSPSPFNVALLRTENSRYNSPEDQRHRGTRLATEPTETLNKPQSQVSFTLSPSPQPVRSPVRGVQEKRFEDYKTNFSLLNYRQKGKEEEKEGKKGSSGGKESSGKQEDESARKESAVERLKRSQQVMNSVYLPQIASTKEKLMKKMKEKRSYVKTIQAHLNDSSLATMREGEKRKELIRKLYEYT